MGTVSCATDADCVVEQYALLLPPLRNNNINTLLGGDSAFVFDRLPSLIIQEIQGNPKYKNFKKPPSLWQPLTSV